MEFKNTQSLYMGLQVVSSMVLLNLLGVLAWTFQLLLTSSVYWFPILTNMSHLCCRKFLRAQIYTCTVKCRECFRALKAGSKGILSKCFPSVSLWSAAPFLSICHCRDRRNWQCSHGRSAPPVFISLSALVFLAKSIGGIPHLSKRKMAGY